MFIGVSCEIYHAYIYSNPIEHAEVVVVVILTQE